MSFACDDRHLEDEKQDESLKVGFTVALVSPLHRKAESAPFFLLPFFLAPRRTLAFSLDAASL